MGKSDWKRCCLQRLGFKELGQSRKQCIAGRLGGHGDVDPPATC